MSPASAPTPSCNQQAETFSSPIRKQATSAISRKVLLALHHAQGVRRGVWEGTPGLRKQSQVSFRGSLVGQGHSLGEEVESVPGRVLLKWWEGREDFQLGLAPGPHPPVALSSS